MTIIKLLKMSNTTVTDNTILKVNLMARFGSESENTSVEMQQRTYTASLVNTNTFRSKL